LGEIPFNLKIATEARAMGTDRHSVRLLPRGPKADGYSHQFRVPRHPPLPNAARGVPSSAALPAPKYTASYHAHRDAIARIPRPVSASVKPSLERPRTAPLLPTASEQPAAWMRADILRTEHELAAKAVHVALGEQPASGKAVHVSLNEPPRPADAAAKVLAAARQRQKEQAGAAPPHHRDALAPLGWAEAQHLRNPPRPLSAAGPGGPLANGRSPASMYQHVRTLGKGAFGLVTLVRSQLTGELAAMKTIDRSKLYTENLKKTVEHEIKILKRLKHERIIRLYEVGERHGTGARRTPPATRHRPTTHTPRTPPRLR